MTPLAMLKIALTNLFKKPATVAFPAAPRTYFPNSRNRLTIEVEKCTFCGLCQKKCPSNALMVDRQARTWKVDRLKCILCSSCVDGCPKKCLLMKGELFGSLDQRHKNQSIETFQGPPLPAKPAAPQSAQ